jgi:histidyl-tRNA synthetase
MRSSNRAAYRLGNMSTLRQIRRLPNMSDATAPQIALVEETAARCMAAFEFRGYKRIDTPLIEETELFLRKSGGELSSRLYDFVEPGGFRTSLRPEFTSPMIRYAIETGEAEVKICRYQYFGPVFRYASPEHPDGAKTRQFNQLGAELIGAPAPRADGEVIAMAVEGLDALNVPTVTVALGHVGLLRQLFKKFHLSERASQFLLSNVGLLSTGSTPDVLVSAEKLGFLDDDGGSVPDSPAQREVIEPVLAKSTGPLGANAGARTRQEVIARLARKQTYADDPEKFRSALSMLSELVTISGNAGSALEDGRKLASGNGLDESCFYLLEQVASSAEDQGVERSRITVNYGLARGVAYYTGMVFDILPRPETRDSLGGGGRYDGLTRALGLNADVPALGFAYNFDAVIAALPDNRQPKTTIERVLVRPANDEAWQAAAQVAAELRREGGVVVVGTGEDVGDFAKEITVASDGARVTNVQGQDR